jgi:hypothetical protein
VRREEEVKKSGRIEAKKGVVTKKDVFTTEDTESTEGFRIKAKAGRSAAWPVALDTARRKDDGPLRSG